MTWTDCNNRLIESYGEIAFYLAKDEWEADNPYASFDDLDYLSKLEMVRKYKDVNR